MLAMIEITYGGRKVIQAMNREEYAALDEAVPQFSLAAWPVDDEKKPPVYVFGKHYIDITTQGAYLALHGIGYEVKNFKSTYKAAETKLPDGTNVAIHVHIPNIGLLAINEVFVMEDACTERLQESLNEGWRILAVCPPNGVRRPDYVLGRTA